MWHRFYVCIIKVSFQLCGWIHQKPCRCLRLPALRLINCDADCALLVSLLLRCTSLTPAPSCDRFKLHIPYAGETLKCTWVKSSVMKQIVWADSVHFISSVVSLFFKMEEPLFDLLVIHYVQGNRHYVNNIRCKTYIHIYIYTRGS